MWMPDSGSATAVIADNKGFAVRQKYVIDTPATKGMFKFRIPFIIQVFRFHGEFCSFKRLSS